MCNPGTVYKYAPKAISSTRILETLLQRIFYFALIYSSYHRMAPFREVALPLGSTILVTGVNGYVGSHVADRLLDSGYKVRGTVRDMQKHGWLVELFNKRYGQGRFELMQVEDMARPSAFDSALEGLLGSSLTK
jgi:hypothetical protein